MIRINLLSARGAPAKPRVLIAPQHRGAVFGLSLLLLTGMGVGGWRWEIGRETTAVAKRISQHELELVRLKDAAKLVDRMMARKAELWEKLALIDRLRAAQRGPVNLLSTLNRSLPDGLWLLELKQQGNVVQIEGRANSLTAVTDFVERLQDSGAFDRPVEIVSTGLELLEEASVVRFAVKAQALGTTGKDVVAVVPVRKGN
jgi:Tfp pilus assembly protein PilN